MKRAAFVLIYVFFIFSALSAQPHSGIKFSTTFSDTKLKSEGEQEFIQYSEGSGWELGYSFHIPAIKVISFQIEPAIGKLPLDYSDDYLTNFSDIDRSIFYFSMNTFVNSMAYKGFNLQAGPRWEYALFGSRKSNFNVELSAGLLKHFKWADIYARYYFGLSDSYGYEPIQSSYYGDNGPSNSESFGPETEGYSRRFEVGVVIPLFKFLKKK